MAAALPRPLFYGLPCFDKAEQSKDIPSSLKITCSHDSILVRGRYTKMARGVSQTPWMVNDNAKSSVQDEIAKTLHPLLKPKNGVGYLHAAGREDIDVRMLGTGRPFVYEIMDPQRALTTAKLIEGLSTSGDVGVVEYLMCD